MKNKFKILIILVVLTAAGYAWMEFDAYRKSPKSYVMQGNVVSLEGDKLTVKGNFLVESDSKYLNPEHTQIVDILVNDDVRITKIAIGNPTPEQAGTGYRLGDLPTKESTVSLSELRSDIESNQGLGLEVRSSKNIFNKNGFIPESITYQVRDFSNFTDAN